MAFTSDLEEDAITTALRSFLVLVAPSGATIVLGQSNRVPPPKEGLYIVFTPTTRPRLSTNVVTWDYEDTAPENISMLAPAQMMVQVDIFGEQAFNVASIIEATWRSTWGCETLAGLNSLMQPLYADEPRQLAFIDSNQQYEDRWSVDLNLQINQSISIPQEFSDTLTVELIEIDSTYPP